MGVSTLAWMSLALGGLGTAASVAGGVHQAQARRAQASAQRAYAQWNAQNAEQNARDSMATGRERERQSRMEHHQRTAALRAQAGASGVDVGRGSALDALGDAAMLEEYDALTLRTQAARRARAYRQQAWGQRAQGALDEAAGRAHARDALWGAAGSTLTGASTVGKDWYTWRRGGR